MPPQLFFHIGAALIVLTSIENMVLKYRASCSVTDVTMSSNMVKPDSRLADYVAPPAVLYLSTSLSSFDEGRASETTENPANPQPRSQYGRDGELPRASGLWDSAGPRGAPGPSYL